jgi:hypothetical protein
MLSEIVKIVAPLLVAALVRYLEKKNLRKKGILRDDKYLDDNIRHL